MTYVGEVLHGVGMGYAKGCGGSYAEWMQFHYSNLADYEKLLVTWLGDRRRKFPWGTATAWFDEKGVGSGIFVEYRK